MGLLTCPLQLTQTLRRTWPKWRGYLTVGVLASIYSVLFSEVLTERYLAFQTRAWDLGIYNQAFFTTVTGHGWFYYTADLPSGNNGQLFVTHFSPILALFLPIYAIAPTPPTLLAIETIAVAFIAIPLYVFARAEFKSERWAILLSGICLASPVLLGIVWYDFHAEAFLPLLVVCAVVCYRLRSWKLFLVFWFLALAVIETAAPLMIAFGILAVAGDYVTGHRPLRLAAKRVPMAVWVALVGSLAWLSLDLLAVPVMFGVSGLTGGYSAGYAVNFQVLGANSILSVIPTALFHPANAWSALTFDAARKGTYVALLLGSLGFLPLFGRLRYLLPGLIWPVLAWFSNSGGYYSFGDQYAAYTFPFLAMAAIDGLSRIRSWSSERSTLSVDSRPARPSNWTSSFRRSRRRLGTRSLKFRQAVPTVAIVVLLAGLGVGLALVSPLDEHPLDSLGIPHGVPSVTPHDQLLHTLIGLIPGQASVLTTAGLFPELSSRPDAYVLPISSYFAGNRTFFEVLNSYVNESDFLMYDLVTDPDSASIMQAYVNFSGFGVLAEADGAVLYERGWTLPPQLWTPESLVLSGGSLAVPPAFPAGPNGSYANVLHYSGGFPNGTELWGGPYSELVPGTYRVTLTYRVTGAAVGGALNVEVGARPIVASIVPVDVTSAGHDYSITVTPSPQLISLAQANVTISPGTLPTNLSFTAAWPGLALLDLSGFVLTPSVSVDLYAITVDQVSTL